MCVCNSCDGKYEVIISDNFDNYICNIAFKSITNVCRFLEDADLKVCKIDIVRKTDSKLLDIDMLLSIWRSDFNECEV